MLQYMNMHVTNILTIKVKKELIKIDLIDGVIIGTGVESHI